MGYHVAWDCESYPNVFTCAVAPLDHDMWALYEVSHRRNDFGALDRDMRAGAFMRMYGFNSMGYDYPLLHHMCALWQAYGGNISGPALAAAAWQKTQMLIATEWGKGWENYVWASDHIAEQCDLLTLHHFDNKNKITSLKDIMFNIQCPNMSELPFKPGTILTDQQIEVLIAYNIDSDLWTTKQFAITSRDAIAFREGLIAKGHFGPECLNWNDVKIGEKFFINRLEKAQPGITRKVNGRKPQTHRGKIRIADVIVPYVSFERPELRKLLADLRDMTVDGDEIKGAYAFKVPLDGVEITIGAGGIHGALDRVMIRSTTERVLIDVDVRAYYPNVAIVNEFAPAHIGPPFTGVYASIRDDRETERDAGNMTEAGGLKLANNGGFGMTGSKHSVLRDTQVLLSITVNGQLLQCALAEAILRIPTARILQLNTDGLTVDIPRSYRDMFDDICNWWQRHTCMTLEFTDFDWLMLRDVNSYLAQTTKGKRKRKGAYDWEMLSGSIGGQKAWNKDFSAMVVAKAAEAAIADDQCHRDFIASHDVPYDFLIKERVKGASRLINGHTGQEYGKLLRYYIARDGQPLVKMMPPLAGRTEERRMGIHAEGRAKAVGTRKNYVCDTCGERFVLKSMFDDHNTRMHAWGIRPKMHWDGDLTGLDLRWYNQEAENLIF